MTTAAPSLIHDDLMTWLWADTGLMAILSGGLYPRVAISKDQTPDAFEGGKLLPCASVKFVDDQNLGPPYINYATQLSIYLYQLGLYDVIDAAANVLKIKLHENKIPTSGGLRGIYTVLHDNTIYHTRDTALDCPLNVCNFTILRR